MAESLSSFFRTVMASPRRKRYTVPALDKGLDIVELLSTARVAMTMREIGAKVGRSVSQIFRTLKVLEARNYIERPGAGDGYALTNHLFELGMRRPQVVDLIGTAYPVMVETAAALDQSVHLAVPSHDQMVVIARVENPGGAAFLVKIGNRRSLADAVSGRVLLAFQPDAVRDEWIGHVRKAAPRGFDEKALRRILAQIRERGFELANSPYVVGITDVGFPLFGDHEGAAACLSMPFVSRLDARGTIQEAVEAMRRAAQRISAALDASSDRQRARAANCLLPAKSHTMHENPSFNAASIGRLKPAEPPQQGARPMICRRTVGAILAAAMALLSGAAAAQQPLEIRVGAAQATDHAPVFAAVERGIFARHGLTARVVMYPTGVEMINGLLAGAQEVNVMGSIPFLAGVANGQPLVLIGHLHGDALRDNYADNNSIVAGPASGITEIRGLRGKRIGLPRGTGAEGYLLGILSQNGMTPNDVTLVNIGPPNLVTGLRQGDVDAIAMWEPVASAAALRVPGATRILQAGCTSCYDPGTVLTSRPVIAQRAEQLRRFWLAFAEAEQWVRQNFDAAAEINMRWIQGIDLDIMKSAIRRSNYDPRVSRLTGANYNARTIPALLADRRLPRSFDANTAIDAQFYLHAQSTAPQFFADLPPIPAAQQMQ